MMLLMILFSACHEIEEWANDPRGNFDALWTIIDEHYCFFAEKNVDWDEVYVRYSCKVSDKMTGEELFAVCSDMLNELRDGHTNLAAPFDVSYYRAWKFLKYYRRGQPGLYTVVFFNMRRPYCGCP